MGEVGCSYEIFNDFRFETIAREISRRSQFFLDLTFLTFPRY